MAWTTPHTWAYKEAPSSTIFNSNLRDNMNALNEGSNDGVAWTAFSPGVTGFSSPAVFTGVYKKIGKTVFIQLSMTSSGTSNSSGFTITNLPYAAKRSTQFTFYAYNNGAWLESIGYGNFAAGGTTITLNKNITNNNWTTSGGKGVRIPTFFYETT